MAFSNSTQMCLAGPQATRTPLSPSGPQQPTPNPPQKPTQRARVTLFFDGTLNNRANAIGGSSNNFTDPSLRTGSYDNVRSNIAELEPGLVMCGAPYDQHFSTYVEGIATISGAEDSDRGMALGTGETGIVSRVARGLQWAVKQLSNMPRAKVFEYIHIDAYGFSRGAAAARNFIHEALNGDESIRLQLEAKGFTVNDVHVRFVGLFDTVASYGVVHWNDTSDLSLDAISVADQVIQIAAAEEHRYNFRLTDIGRAAGDKSFELFLPGVHSDIGGGYKPDYAEDLILWEETTSIFSSAGTDHINRERAVMINEGWFTANQLTQTIRPAGKYSMYYALRGKRTVHSNQYSRIPLKFMAEYSQEQALSYVNLLKTQDDFLTRVEAQLRSYASEARAYTISVRNGQQPARGHRSTPDDWIHKNKLNQRQLRSGYLHYSAHYAPAAGGLVHPNVPNFKGSVRTRVIQNG